MLSLNEKFTLLKTVQEQDTFGSIMQSVQEVGENGVQLWNRKVSFIILKAGKNECKL